MLPLHQKDQCGKRLAAAQAMVNRSVKPIARSSQPSSGEIKAVIQKPQNVKEVFKDIPGIRDDLMSTARGSLDEILDDLDYALGKDVIHASSKAGLPEISTSVSAAAMQSNYGLTPQDAVAFSYNPKSYKDNEEHLYNAMSETVGESRNKGGLPTAYLARMPLSGIRTHADLPSTWNMSSKPMRVIRSETIVNSNRRAVEDMIRSASGGDSPEVRYEKMLEVDRLRKLELAQSEPPREPVA